MRIKLQMPDSMPFQTRIKVRSTDLNYANHVGNDRFLAYLQEARRAFFQELGYTDINIEGVGTVLADAALQFKSEAFYGDELMIEMGIEGMTRVSFDLYYRITRSSDERVVLLAKTALVCFDYESKKVMSIPQVFKQKLGLA